MVDLKRSALLLVIGAVGCAPSFRSVRETAAMGVQVGATSAVLLTAPRTCALQEAVVVLQPGRLDARCADLKVAQSARIFYQASHLIAAFAGSMQSMAARQDVGLGTLTDFFSNTKAAVEGSPASLSVGSAGTKLSAVMSLLSADWRRRELRRYVIDAQPHLGAMVEGLRLHVRLSREVLSSLRGAPPGPGGQQERGLVPSLQRELADIAGALRCGERDLPCKTLKQLLPGQSLSLLAVEAELAEQAEALERYDQALSSFWSAFQVLHRHAQVPADGMRNDLGMYEEIKLLLSGGK